MSGTPREDDSSDLMVAVLAQVTGFLSAESAVQAVAEYSRESPVSEQAPSPEAFADWLVRRGWLSAEARQALQQLARVRSDEALSGPESQAATLYRQEPRQEHEPDETLLAVQPRRGRAKKPHNGEAPADDPEAQLQTQPAFRAPATDMRHTPPGGAATTPETSSSRDNQRPTALEEASAEATIIATRRRGDRYEFKREVARGGLGRVSLVRDHECRRDIALKELLPSGSADPLRFLEEGRITAQLEHPNIVPVYEIGTTEQERPYYTMRFIRGRPMTELIRELKRQRASGEVDAKQSALDRMQLLGAFTSAAQAVAYAHSKGVIHRDLKPENIMVGAFGEVLVVDWGLAKVKPRPVEKKTGEFVETSRARAGAQTVHGTVAGTPAYMSPEQASGLTDLVDERSDVYSLGVVLYEILTHTPPYRGRNALEVLTQVRNGELEPPSQRAPELQIPPTLEEICLKAMAHEREARYEALQELAEAVTLFIEGTQEREKMHERAEAKVSEAREKQARYQELQEAEGEARRHFEELEREVSDTDTPLRKRELWDAERDVERLRDERVEAYNAVLRAYTEALGFEPDNASAHADMAELFWQRFRDAEEQEEQESQAFYRSQVELHDLLGQYRDALRGDGSLELHTQPEGGSVRLGRYEEIDRRYQVSEESKLGKTPQTLAPMPMGSYLATIEQPGYRRIYVPVHIGRQEAVKQTVRLVPAGRLMDDAQWIHVPGGPFIWGTRQPVHAAAPKEMRHEEDFFVQRTPVTVAEYLRFLNELQARDPEEAARRQPRAASESGFYWTFDEATSSYRLPRGEEVERFAWEASWPVFGVSWHDAIAYCAWLGEKLGLPVTLPTESQWEKAARGVDGRLFPWGNRTDATWLNCAQTRENDSRPMPVGSFPIDCSPYGVLDMAGNVGDWCLDETEGFAGWRNLRGGYWTQALAGCSAAVRRGYNPDAVFHYIGFRPAIPWCEELAQPTR